MEPVEPVDPVVDGIQQPVFYVDIPNLHSEDWINVASFTTRPKAIAFAKERFGADDEGRVCLVTG